MNNIRKLLAIIFITVGINVYAQDDTFQQRLTFIDLQLDLMSDSLVAGLNETANFSVSGMPIQSFLRSIAESHRLNIQIDPALNFSVTNNFTNVLVKELLYFLCEEYYLDIRFTSTIMSFYKYQPPKLPDRIIPAKKLNVAYDPGSRLLSFDLSNDSLRTVAKEITRLTNTNVIVSGGPDVENRLVRGFIKDLAFENALDKLAYTNGLILTKTKDGVFILEPDRITQNQQQSNNGQFNPGATSSFQPRNSTGGDVTMRDSLLFMNVTNFPIIQIINQASELMNVDFILFSEITGNTSATVNGISYQSLLSLLFQGTSFTYKKKSGVYLIGQRNVEGFRTSELIKLQYRTTDGIEREIPTDMLKEVELKIHRELNALIITGNKHKIDEIATFVELIDRPIPNILIEVIVADVRKGYSIETGLKAFLSADSLPATQGQVFPGIDVTLSSKAVNDVLSKLDSKGLVNLGRVTPRFYAQLKAMEKNNNIQLRSTPKLSTMNGSRATLVMGESVYYVQTTQNITGGVTPVTTTTQQFNKVDANLSIIISPIVSGNEHITLDITAEFSDFIAPTIQNAPPGNSTRKFESKIRVRNEEMIILGGLEETSKSETGSGVPLLSRIPILKWIFSSKSKESSDNRLIVFIKPTLVY